MALSQKCLPGTVALTLLIWACPIPKAESLALLYPIKLNGRRSTAESCFPWTQMNIQFALFLSQSRAECFPAAKIVLLDSKSPENLSVG